MFTTLGRTLLRLNAVAALLGLAALPAMAQQIAPAGKTPEVGAMERHIDPRADELLKKSLDYLASQKALTVDVKNTLDVILVNG